MRIFQVTKTSHLFGGREIYASRQMGLLAEAERLVRWLAPADTAVSLCLNANRFHRLTPKHARFGDCMPNHSLGHKQGEFWMMPYTL